MKWTDALKIWNEGKGTWCIPRKGTEAHAEVMKIVNAGPAKEKTSKKASCKCGKKASCECGKQDRKVMASKQSVKDIQESKSMSSRPVTSSREVQQSLQELKSMSSKPMTQIQNEPTRQSLNIPKIMTRNVDKSSNQEESKVEDSADIYNNIRDKLERKLQIRTRGSKDYPQYIQNMANQGKKITQVDFWINEIGGQSTLQNIFSSLGTSREVFDLIYEIAVQNLKNIASNINVASLEESFNDSYGGWKKASGVNELPKLIKGKMIKDYISKKKKETTREKTQQQKNEKKK